jgi:mannose-6-phosphate isomerase-like protein (cupin superfamily)
MADDTIEDPVTGQRIVFVERTEERVAAELFVRPGGFVPVHVHASQAERFEGVSGRLRFRVGRRRRALGCGETLVVPAGAAHGFRNEGAEVAHFLIELSPPRRGEEGLRTLFGLQRDGRVRLGRAGVLHPLLQVAVLFDEYLDEVHLPLVPFGLQRLGFRMLARLGARRGYVAAFPEYAAPTEASTPVGGAGVEPAGLEPATFWLPARRSPS